MVQPEYHGGHALEFTASADDLGTMYIVVVEVMNSETTAGQASGLMSTIM